MADIETSVVISAQIDGLRSGMEAASNSVQAATDAMRAQLAGLGDIAQQAQSQLNAATGQIGTGNRCAADKNCRPRGVDRRGHDAE